MVIRKTASMNATLSYDRVLEMVLDVSASAIANGSPEDRRLVCALLLVAGDQLEVESARGLTSTDLRVRLPGVNGAVERALAAGGLVEIEDPARDPELQRFVGLHACRSGVCLPLVVGLEVYGLLLFAAPRPGVLLPGAASSCSKRSPSRRSWPCRMPSSTMSCRRRRST